VTVVGFLRRVAGVLACAALTVAVQGCADPPTGPSMSAPFNQTDLRVGTGDEAAFGNSITVNYTGWLYDASKPDAKGLQFDSSVGGAPFTFTLGAGGVIVGWDEGLVGMKAGGARRLIIPSSLAYGGIRNGPIPPFATLVFDIELVEVVKP
jgi:FKBP-type peptidyl-prolyl cis-trans isomerase FkpA